MYQALYRVWRPRTFSDMVGQEAVVRTLKNQVKTGHIAHAYLFCGSRGTGKTSAAKIMARAINCTDPRDGDPCGECESCHAILNDASLDVYEMDAASNSRVEETREMLEKVDYPPQFGKYKVYIIDEVHMLSNSAFNALLKTLEEPPSYMVFILATTEPQKIPATILSRCQRYDFGRFTEAELTGRMQHILDSNGRKAQPEALQLIASAAEGGMRDALSILDMCMSGDGEITEAHVRSTLGSADKSFIFAFADALAAGDRALAMQKCTELMRSGQDVNVFLKDLSNHLRALCLVRLGGPDAVPGGTQYAEQSKKFSTERLLRMLDIYMQAQGDTRWAPSARNVLEISTLKCCREVTLEDTGALLERLEEMERKVSNIEKNGITLKSAPVEAPTVPAVPQASDDSKEEALPEDSVSEGSKMPKDVWNDMLKLAKKSAPLIFSFLQQGTYGGYTDNTYRAFFDSQNKLMIDMLSKPDKQKAIEDLLKQSGGGDCHFAAMPKPDQVNPEKKKLQQDIQQQLTEMFGRDKLEIID